MSARVPLGSGSRWSNPVPEVSRRLLPLPVGERWGEGLRCSIVKVTHDLPLRRLWGTPLRLLALVVALALAVASPALSRADVLPLQGGQTIRIEGQGWGHGVGMSQWGARGRAMAGQTADQIVRAYYTGIDITDSPTDQTQIRVLIQPGLPPVLDRRRGPVLQRTGWRHHWRRRAVGHFGRHRCPAGGRALAVTGPPRCPPHHRAPDQRGRRPHPRL